MKSLYEGQVEEDLVLALLEDDYILNLIKNKSDDVVNQIFDFYVDTDEVTGKRSDSYFCSEEAAKATVLDYGMPILREAAARGVEYSAPIHEMLLNEEWEALDVFLRQYTLGKRRVIESAIAKVAKEKNL